MASQNAWRITRAGIIFIIVVILLGAVTYAGIYFVKQRGEQARQDEASQIAQENLDGESDGPVVIGQDDNDEQTTDDDTDSTDGAGQGSSSDGSGSSTGAGTGSGSTDNDGDGGEIADSTTLPETGPELMNLLAVAALTLTTTAAITSYRTLAAARR